MIGTPLTVRCQDGYELQGTIWRPRSPSTSTSVPAVVIVGATGVSASYYHRYASFLAENGFAAITFDYRGIGRSRGATIRNLKASWYDWGLKDIDAVLEWSLTNIGNNLLVVGHSFGGFGVGLAKHGREITRLLTVGAQHAHWRDYRSGHRLRFWWRWHMLMPIMTLGLGYFPGKRLGWLEDLPKGVALNWARSRKNFPAGAGPMREVILAHQSSFTAATLAVSANDDPFASEIAIARGLNYYSNSPATVVVLKPQDLDESKIGHFALFHSRFRDTFWTETLQWLQDGTNPWAHTNPDTYQPDNLAPPK
ncbi:alpha/beta fold hydrolase [Arthrobacter sp. SX1312]|uniref:alpha/beta hydrolase family protein n=1 Tax=Arthrobacter sp. SX1312 TaxID=2058896 RepID=UPI000CE54DE4|nr:alpha/beta fold hydrolase [Arthrobacter sp. SX1312]